MITKRTRHYCIIALSFFSIAPLHGLTTLQQNDPDPIYSANNCMMPPNSHFLDLVQARMNDETPSKNRAFGINISGFVQGAVTAYGYDGCDIYGTECGVPQNGFEMGDFRGTMYAMGLFLGKNPNNGLTIWTPGSDPEDGNVADITQTSIQNFFDGKSECLEDIALELAGHGINTNPLIFYNTSATTPPTPITTPSIFTESQLARDTVYFGAFSLPISYRKQGFRWEINVNLGDYFGLTFQSGVANIKQKFVSAYKSQTTAGQTNYGPYSISSIASNCTTAPCPSLSSLYTSLNTSNNPTTSSNASAQAIFNAQISNNLGNILNPTCGSTQSICAFDDTSIEDLRFFLTLKYPHDVIRGDREIDGDNWPYMIFTPYAYVAGSAPIAKCTNYGNILSLPFGNNGHGSICGAGGMTFDFVESIEVGFEGGVTYFFAKDEYRPFPTHKLQRVLYPFATHVHTQPGINGNFKAMMSAYQFLPHVNFWFVYEIIEHRKDCFKLCCDGQAAQYFVPEVLECYSDWRAQFFNAGLSFDIQPGMQASIAWQQPITPRNAYYPVTIIGSINFMF